MIPNHRFDSTPPNLIISCSGSVYKSVWGGGCVATSAIKEV